ncbi:MAG: hypothetical protein ACFFCZ_08640 [Promethearchaeota archaeon]
MTEDGDFVEVPGYGRKRKDLRPWWNNVTNVPDDEILAIDELEDKLEFTSDVERKRVHEIRKQIGRLEMCHFKVMQYITRIIHAIKYLDEKNPDPCPSDGEDINHEWFNGWNAVLDYLEHWVNYGSNPGGLYAKEGTITTSILANPAFYHVSLQEINEILGEPSDVKKWQVRFIIEYMRGKLDAFFNNPPESRYPVAKRRHEKLIKKYRNDNPEYWESLENLHLPHQPHDLSFGGLLHDWGYFVCEVNPNYMNDLLTVLGAIGNGSEYRFRGCGYKSEDLKVFLKETLLKLRAFVETDGDQANEMEGVRELLGEKTPIREWLVASLEKTIRGD